MAEFLKQYQLLFTKAKTDLRAATILLHSFNRGDSELDLEVIYFHLQQATEKGVKAYLSFHQINFPKVHDLELLISLISPSEFLENINTELIIELSDFAVEGRYNMIHDEIDQIESYFAETDRLLNKIATIIKTSL